MPQLPQYTQQIEAQGAVQGRTATASDFSPGLSNLAPGLQALDETLYTNKVRDDVTQVHVTMAKARAAWTNQLLQSSTYAQTKMQSNTGEVGVGGDAPTEVGTSDHLVVNDFSDKFLGDYNNFMSQARGQVKTREGARLFDQLNASMGADFQEKAFAMQSSLKGIQAVQDYLTATNSYRNALLQTPDDKSFKSALHESMLSLAAMQNIPVGKRIELENHTREVLALSAVEGQIHAGPVKALDDLDSGHWNDYIQPDKAEIMIRRAHIAIAGQDAMAERQRRAAVRQEEERRDGEEIKLLTNFSKGDGQFNDSNILDAHLSPEKTLQYMELLRKPVSTKSDPATFHSLFERANLPNTNEDKIVDENEINSSFLAGKITFEDLTRLRNEVTSDRTPEGQRLNASKKDFLDAFRPQFDKSNIMQPDPSGKEDMYRFQAYVDGRLADTRANHEDPYALFSPNSVKYLGKDVGQFKKTLAQRMKAITQEIQSVAPKKGVPQIGPNETPEQYFKRIGQ